MIKKIFHTGTFPLHVDWMLLILRLTAGIFMLTHGVGKFMKLFGEEPVKFADPLGIGVTASLALAVFAEVFCAVLLIIGLCTRLAVIPLLITMLVAAWIVNFDQPFAKQELALLYGLLFLTIAVIGPGKISLDQLIYEKRIKPIK